MVADYGKNVTAKFKIIIYENKTRIGALLSSNAFYQRSIFKIILLIFVF